MTTNTEGTTIADVIPLHSTMRSLLNRTLLAKTGFAVCRGCGAPIQEADAFPVEQGGIYDGGGYEGVSCGCLFQDFPPDHVEPPSQNARKGILEALQGRPAPFAIESTP